MDEKIYVLRDDVSSCGLRRYHIMRSGDKFCKEEAYEIQRKIRVNETYFSWITWQDELDNWHIYLVWREIMEVMAVATGENLVEAVRVAQMCYFRRTGRLPNRLVVREGTFVEDDGKVTFRDVKGDETTEVTAIVEKVKWLRKGDVGVYFKAEGDSLGVEESGMVAEDRGVEVQKRAYDGDRGADGERSGEPAAVPGGDTKIRPWRYRAHREEHFY